MTAHHDGGPSEGHRARPSVARAVVAILAGYALFAITGWAFFAVSRRDPHAVPSTVFLVLSIAWGAACALLGGYVATVIAGRRDLVAGIGVALLMALGATMSIAMQPEEVNHWSQVAAIVVMAPAAVIGAALKRRAAAKT